MSFYDEAGQRLATVYLTKDNRRVYAIQIVAASDADCYRE
jgi:hypothetical protein